MSPFWQEILGKDNDPNVLGAAFAFALLGHFIVLLGGTAFREPKSLNSPQNFSMSYLLCDNAKRILYVLLVIVGVLRFCPDILGKQVSAFAGFCVGLGLDSIALLIKQKTKLLDPTPKQ